MYLLGGRPETLDGTVDSISLNNTPQRCPEANKKIRSIILSHRSTDCIGIHHDNSSESFIDQEETFKLSAKGS
jgi:hypothetical protein